MDDHEFEGVLRRVLGRDFSAGTDEFRNGLLARCLAVLNAGDNVIELGDAELEMLAAAGDQSAQALAFGDNELKGQ